LLSQIIQYFFNDLINYILINKIGLSHVIVTGVLLII
jgi:hypothetical protein